VPNTKGESILRIEDSTFQTKLLIEMQLNDMCDFDGHVIFDNAEKTRASRAAYF
jgi:hypothetical protein